MTFFVIVSADAQRWKLTRYEACAGVGFINYFGDVGGTSLEKNWYGLKDINLFRTRPALSAGARYKTTEESAVKLNLILMWLNGNDKNGDNYYRKYRFNTIGLEHSLQFEYALLREDRRKISYAIYNRRGLISSYTKKGVYLFGGLGGNINYIFLKRDSSNYVPTIDITKKGFNFSGVVFGGVMIKFIYNNYYAFSFEFGGRYILNDYIDGLTTKISKFNDIYYFTNFSIIYRIKTSRKGYPILFKRYY